MTPEEFARHKNLLSSMTQTTKLSLSNNALPLLSSTEKIVYQNYNGDEIFMPSNMNPLLIPSETPYVNVSCALNKNKSNNINVHKFLCPCCEKQFKKKKRLEIHIRSHTGQKPYKCTYPNCGKSFNEKGNLKTHIRIHTGEKPFKCNFSNCGKQFTTCGHLKDHRRQHTGERPYFCHLCGENFVRSSTLRIHIRIHTGEKPYSCFLCPKKFSECGNLNTHLKIIHNFVKPSLNKKNNKKKKIFQIEKPNNVKSIQEEKNGETAKPENLKTPNLLAYPNTIQEFSHLHFKLPSLIDQCPNPNPCLSFLTDQPNTNSNFSISMRNAINLNKSMIQNNIASQVPSLNQNNSFFFIQNANFIYQK